ncbi:MAG: hypothetical protein D6706_13795 [Chloroflexi bacterium]|nr:MAG: hypothetical protein D6706_13795 [Chloroflexota bacterium]
MIKFIRSLLSNLATLLLSFILAVIIWVNAVQTEDPIQSRFLQIPLEIVGQPQNSILITPTNLNQTIQIVIQGPASIITPLTSDDFSALLDLSQLPLGDTILADIQVQAKVPNVTILSQSPEQLEVHLEQRVSRDIPVVAEIRGSVARGLAPGDPLLDPPVITVSGPASQVEILDFARVTIFLNNNRETVIDTPQPIFYDKQGNVASVRGLELSTEEVKVTIPVNETAGFAEKFISVDLTGEPAPGYRLLSVKVEPSSVLVRGLPTRLEDITQVQTEPIDITGLAESFTQQVTVNLPPGITLAEVEEIFVTVEIEPILTTGIYNRAPVLQGLGEGLEAIITPKEVRVILFGPLPVLDALLDEEVQVTIDLFGLQPGTYSLEPKVSFPDRGIELRSVQPSLVTVEITEVVSPTEVITPTAVLPLIPIRLPRSHPTHTSFAHTNFSAPVASFASESGLDIRSSRHFALK